MKDEFLNRWIHNIFATQNEEMDCAQASEALSQYVDVEASGQEAACLLPDVCQHLQQCRECNESYEALLEIACLEAGGELPKTDELMEDVLRTCGSLSLELHQVPH